MPRLTTLKKMVMAGAFAAALAAGIGWQTTGMAAQAQQLWSIVIHFQYDSGFEFDYVLRRGVSTADLPAALAECAQSHSTPSVVRYHCYPVAE